MPRPSVPRLSRRNQRFSVMFDARPDRLDFRDLPYRAPLRSLAARYPDDDILYSRMPAYVKAGMVRDQKAQGACTGFGLAAVVNFLLWKRSLENGPTDQPDRVSPHMLYELARRYDEWDGEDYQGSSCRGALKGFHKHGVCLEPLWPGPRTGPRDGLEWEMDALKRPLGVYYRIDRESVVDMQSAIDEVGAIYVSARVHDGWDRVTATGLPPRSHDVQQLPVVPPASPDSLLGGHAFALVGYNERGFIVQNSWGTGWGACGFAVMPYEDWVRHGTDAWAAALGVPQTRSHSPEAMDALRWPSRSGRSLGFAASGRLQPDNPPDDPWPIDKPFLHKPYQPWSTARAYEHTLVSGNNGHVIVTDLTRSVDSAASDFVEAHLDRLRQRMQALPVPRLVIYAHGGLNSEAESIDRIRVLAPYFDANDICPLFLTWRTGPLETLCHLLEDRVREAFGLGDKERVQRMGALLGEARDRAVEALASPTVSPLWSEMKQNARRSALRGRGSDLLARNLASWQPGPGGQPLELHLVGHSAGAILLGHLLGQLAAQNLRVASCTLFAPACTTAFALEHYGRVAAPVLGLDRLHIHLLTDTQEKDDDLLRLGPVTLYGKSLLYLVSRALEDTRKMPLIGLERAHDANHVNTDQWARSELKALHDWQALFPRANLHRVPRPYITVDREGQTARASHGGFDNDIDALTQTITRIRGQAPAHPLEWLSY